MKKTMHYSTANTKMIYNNLINLYNQGMAKDFEIKIDDLTVVHRTNDPARFYLYQKSLTPDSNEVSVFLYKGNSRRYDKYLLIRKAVSSDSGVLSDEQFQKKLTEALEMHKQKMEFEQLKAKTKSQKKTIFQLRQKIQELQAKSGLDLPSITGLLKVAFNSKSTENEDRQVNGFSTNQLAEMIDHYRNKFGEEVFSDALGIALKIAEHPILIKEVSEFVESKIKEHENSKK